MKDQVYSWRIDGSLKSALEEAARNSNTTLAGLLEGIATEWLENQPSAASDAQIQAELKQSARKCFGTLSGSDYPTSEKTREAIRNRLKRRQAG